ncbi:MAG: porin, partial [Chthoniobacterales bacterium]
MNRVSRHLAACIFLLGVSPALRAQSNEASATERLERLERAVQLLQQRNTELEKEVSSLQAKKSAPVASAPSTTAPAPASDGKSGVEKTEVKEEKKMAYAVAAGSEFKLTLGGFIQAQIEAGDVSAFEGRFQSGSGAIKDRFRIRRARINVSGEYAEQFDFKLEGEFGQSDTTLTVRDASGRTLASSSNRTAFGATDIFANWHRFPELNVKVGQYK